MICGRRFSFITIASIDFWNDLQLIFLHFNACILPSIIRHIVVYAVWYGVWFLIVWPWFGHSSLNHNEYAVSSAVFRMKMPPVREYASSTMWAQNVKSRRNVYCYYNNVLLIPSPESPDDFATDVLMIIDWSMDIYDLCSDWSISSMDTATPP